MSEKLSEKEGAMNSNPQEIPGGSKLSSNDQNKPSYVYTGEQLLNLNVEKIPMLLEPLIPQGAVVALAGSSDTGKSSLLRQLACTIALGSTDFLGFKLNLNIYVSTEDNDKAVSALLRKQKQGDTENSSYRGLRYIFDTSKLLLKLEEQLQKEPADCIIVDAFMDLYGGDANASNIVRTFIQPYSNLAQKYNCSVIFLHHNGKRTEYTEPSKNNLLGSQGFEGKMRMVMLLNRDPDSNKPTIRHLCIVKGNYVPEELKQKSFVLTFDPETMRFSNTGERVAFENLAKRNSRENDEVSRAKERVFTLRKEGKSFREIETTLADEGLPGRRSTISEWAKAMIDDGEAPSENEPQVPAPFDDE